MPSVLGTLLLVPLAPAPAQVFSVQFGAQPLPPTVLVQAGDLWRYRKGTNAPPVNWHSVPDAALDATWLTGPGGFGFGDGDDATVLSDMQNNYYTVYIRRSFEITGPVDPGLRLQLVMDYDDGFVAYLDGVEVARSPNVPGAPGSIHPHNAGVPTDREATGYRGLPLEVYDLGPVGNRLEPGTHVLALQGINGTLNSSDLSLIAHLRLTGGVGGAIDGAFFTLVQTNVVLLSGTNTLPGSTRVVVNGLEATYDPASGLWSKAQPLAAGLNRLFLAALDASGGILASTNRDVLAELSSVRVGGWLGQDTVWSSAQGVIRVTNDVLVADDVMLRLEPGTVVLLSPNTSIRTWTNGLTVVEGEEANPVWFLPADGTSPWRELSAQGANAELTLRHTEVVAGQVIVRSEAVVTLEDSVLRDYRVGGRLLVDGDGGRRLTLRRCHLLRYEQIHIDRTPVLIEDCLFEHVGSDATDFADESDVVVRRTTFRFGSGVNTDAIDNGNNPGMVVDSCLIHSFPDKAVSIADSSHGTVVRNSLFYNNGYGISAYAASNCVFEHNTIVGCVSGLALYVRSGRPGPGQGAGTNNILWGNTTNLHLSGGATLELGYSLVGGTNWPGEGNLDADPLFVDPAGGDYRLGTGSPAAGAGWNGQDLGVAFPVGGLPPAPWNLAARPVGNSRIDLSWREDADNEAGFLIERSIEGGSWEILAATSPNVTDHSDLTVARDVLYFYRVRAINHAGRSRWSNLAAAMVQAPRTVVGGLITGDTDWSPAMGEILAFTNVIVPSNVTLRLLPGTLVKLSNSVSLRAVSGGTIEIAGTEENKVLLLPMTSSNAWRELSARGTNASLLIRHAEVAGIQATVYDGALGVFEDSFFRDYRLLSGGTLFTAPILLGQFPRFLAVRRCHIREYHETLFRNGLYEIEDCLFENIYGDGLDFDAAWPGTVLRRCTFRHGTQGNVDAVDVGNDGANSCLGVTVESCLMYDFPFDKGVSIGENSQGIVVSNCLIYQVYRGVQVKDTTTATICNNTIVEADIGIHCYEKIARTGGGLATNTCNNILWDVNRAVAVETNSVLVVNYTILQNTNWPGTGNLSVDPLFLDPARRDYRVAPGSPAVGSGLDGANRGAAFPVGAPMAPSHPQLEFLGREGNAVVLQFWADPEKSYRLEATEDLVGGAWNELASVPAPLRPRRVTLHDEGAGATRFYRLVWP